MNEKRFEAYDLIFDGFIKDTLTNENIVEPIKLIHLLNELFEEREYFERKKEYFLSKWSIAHAENIQLRQENKELRQERERWMEKTDKLEQYLDSLFWGNTHICKHLDVEMVKFWCDKEKKYHIPHCTYEDCFKEENLVKTADEVLRSVDDE